jgi:PDGLE domain
VLVALLCTAVVSQFAVDNPDGLERVAEDTGFIESAQDHALAESPFADYATRGLANESLSLAVAGVAGVVITLLVGMGLVLAVRDRSGPRERSPVV